MSKVFFFNIPFHGHVNPSLGLVKELVRRGEEVIYYCTDSFKEKIESTGAVYRSYGKGFYLDENFVTFNITELCKVHMELSARIQDEILRHIKDEKPDYIIHDSLCTWAKHAAQISNIPAVNTITTLILISDSMSASTRRGFIKDVIITVAQNVPNMIRIFSISRRLKKNFGIKVNNIIDVLENKEKLNIVYTSKEFQPDSETLQNEYTFVGPASMYRDEHSSNFKFNLPKDKPLIFISMGTLFNNNGDFFNKCFEAFGGMNLNVLMSVGKDINISSLAVPENFTVMRYSDIPQLDVLGKCDAFITHGGMNSTHEALFNGIPLIVIPQQSEQAMVSRAVERSGSGIRLNGADITPEILKKSLEKIITDQSFRSNALKIRDSFISAGGPGYAVDVILSFVGSVTGISREI